MEEELSLDEAIHEGIERAMEAFRGTLARHLYDSAYCDLRFTVWVKDSSFTTRLRRIEIEDECKQEEK